MSEQEGTCELMIHESLHHSQQKEHFNADFLCYICLKDNRECLKLKTLFLGGSGHMMLFSCPLKLFSKFLVIYSSDKILSKLNPIFCPIGSHFYVTIAAQNVKVTGPVLVKRTQLNHRQPKNRCRKLYIND